MHLLLILVYSVPLTLFITMGARNATNLIDGLDGLCSEILGIMSAWFLVLSLHLHTWSDWHSWYVQRVTRLVAMMGLGWYSDRTIAARQRFSWATQAPCFWASTQRY